MKRKVRDTGADYTIVVLGGKLLTDDLEDCIKIKCTNKIALSKITGISYDRLLYLFGKKHKSFLIEKDHLIIKTSVIYKGNQPGGIRNQKLFLRGNND
jgi:hypothetical protein